MGRDDSGYDLSFHEPSVECATGATVTDQDQYVLGYRSTNGVRDGKWRRISLKIHPPAGMPDMIIRGKSGYYAPIATGSPQH